MPDDLCRSLPRRASGYRMHTLRLERFLESLAVIPGFRFLMIPVEPVHRHGFDEGGIICLQDVHLITGGPPADHGRSKRGVGEAVGCHVLECCSPANRAKFARLRFKDWPNFRIWICCKSREFWPCQRAEQRVVGRRHGHSGNGVRIQQCQ